MQMHVNFVFQIIIIIYFTFAALFLGLPFLIEQNGSNQKDHLTHDDKEDLERLHEGENLQRQVAHAGFEVVHGAAVIQTGVFLCQVVHHQRRLGLFAFDLVPLRLCDDRHLGTKEPQRGAA